MFNKHPKGLIAASFANLGERFGFYTMMAILVLFYLHSCIDRWYYCRQNP